MVNKKCFVLVFIFICRFKYGLLTDCNNDEVTSNCVNKLCQYTKCSQIDQPIVCASSSGEACSEGCICKDKYLRADNGTCIPLTKCPNYGKCTKENEYYDLCPSPCVSRVCGESNLGTDCTVYLADNSTCLPPACVCKIGFYRNYDGNCVVKNLCATNSSLPDTVSTETTQSTTSTTESSSSSSSLTSTSSTPQSTTTDQINYGSTTISQFSNTTTQKCRKVHEKYEKNPCTLCQPFTCSQVGFSSACAQSDYSRTCNLQPGCYCISGYVRNDLNVCVPVNKCPSCGGDVNAESGCRVICPTCYDYWNKTTACSRLCKLNGCGCKRRYVYDAAQNICVPLRNYCPKNGK